MIISGFFEDAIAVRFANSFYFICFLRCKLFFSITGISVAAFYGFYFTGLHEAHFRCLLDFFKKVDKLGLDGVEYGLLSSIILFDCGE